MTGQTAAEALASVNRDTANTAGALAPIFDKEKVQAGFDIACQFVKSVRRFAGAESTKSTADEHKVFLKGNNKGISEMPSLANFAF